MPRSADPQEILSVLNRVRDALAIKRLSQKSVGRTIKLGLERVEKAIPRTQKWKGIHIGGTNGKGSIVAYLSGLMKIAGISHGTYTSPAFPERHNGVSINGLYCNKRMYEMERLRTKEKVEKAHNWWTFPSPEEEEETQEDLTPFERETATAFRVFDKMNVRYGIIEVGMGGATDATNAMRQKSITVISKIGLDHQEYLGTTLEEIARVKAGIMRVGVPCVVDESNPPEVIKELRKYATEISTDLVMTSEADDIMALIDRQEFQLESYQESNLRCAVLAFRHLFPTKVIDINTLLRLDPRLPGRMEWINAEDLTDGKYTNDILVDGAHNMLGIEALSAFVEKNIRTETSTPITWIMSQSSSASKPFIELIQRIVKPVDNFAFVEYTRGENEPESASAQLGTDVARTLVDDDSQVYDGEPNITKAIQWAAEKASETPVVITGSLYLIRELLALEGIKRRQSSGMRRPGRSQLWHYIKEARTRNLTPEEKEEFILARRHWILDPNRFKHPLMREADKSNHLEGEVTVDAIKDWEEASKRLKYMSRLRGQLEQLREDITLEKWTSRNFDLSYEDIFDDDDDEKAPDHQRVRVSGHDQHRVDYMHRLKPMTLPELYAEQDRVLKQWNEHREAYNAAAYRARVGTNLPGEKWPSYEEVFEHAPPWPRKVGVSNSFTDYLDPDINEISRDNYIEAVRERERAEGRDPEDWLDVERPKAPKDPREKTAWERDRKDWEEEHRREVERRLHEEFGKLGVADRVGTKIRKAKRDY